MQLKCRGTWSRLNMMILHILHRFRFNRTPPNAFSLDGYPNQSEQTPWLLDNQGLSSTQKTLERILTDNIIPFWYPGTLDSQNGGYRLNHDLGGKWQGPANKGIVSQARMVWFFSRLFKSSYGKSEHLKAASHGYEFLRNRMYDKEYGGYYWEVDSAGNQVTIADKNIYGQAFALYALTEYARASGDSSARSAAQELFSKIETKCHDAIFGGYPEILQRDWSAVVGRAAQASSVKRMNTHIHLMEALTTFCALTGEPLARERLVELIIINSNSVVRKTIGACTDQYLNNWEPLRGYQNERVSYGHDLENVWLLVEACRTAGIAANLLLDLYRSLFANALRYGYDHTAGGFYDSGCLNLPADRPEKIWWVQAEALVASLQMYCLTGEGPHWNCFWQTLRWIIDYQADWQRGDWYEIVGKEGEVSGVKAGPWKSAYHNGRAMIFCLDLLASMRLPTPLIEANGSASNLRPCLMEKPGV